jgi:hypothetical protein
MGPPGVGAWEPASARLRWCPATPRWSPPDRQNARRWASFVGPLRADSWRADDRAGPAGRARHRAHPRNPGCGVVQAGVLVGQGQRCAGEARPAPAGCGPAGRRRPGDPGGGGWRDSAPGSPHRGQHRGHRVGSDPARHRMPPNQQLGWGPSWTATLGKQQQQVDPGRPDGGPGPVHHHHLVGVSSRLSAPQVQVQQRAASGRRRPGLLQGDQPVQVPAGPGPARPGRRGRPRRPPPAVASR